MATWPVSLPQKPLAQGYQSTYRPSYAEFVPDAGPIHKISRSTTQIVTEQWAFLLESVADLITFQDFYKDDLSGGVLPITLNNPITGVSTDYTIIGDPFITAVSVCAFNVSFAVEYVA